MEAQNDQPGTVSLFQWRKLLSLFLSFCLGLVACLMVNSVDSKQRVHRKVSRPLPPELEQGSHERSGVAAPNPLPKEKVARAIPNWDVHQFPVQANTRVAGIGELAPYDTLTSLRIRLQI